MTGTTTPPSAVRTSPRYGPVRTGLFVGCLYYVLVSAVLAFEYLNADKTKPRGFLPNTFDPLVFSRIVGWPGSDRVHTIRWAEPGPLSELAWQLAAIEFAQAVVVGLVVGVTSALLARRRAGT